MHWVGVTARYAGTPFTAAHTDDRVLVVDRAQYAQGDGPALAAMRTDQKTAATLEQARRRWPLLAGAATAAGVRSFLSEPLHAGGRTVGSLNLYSDRPGGLRTPGLDPTLLAVLAGYLDRGLADYRGGHPGADGAARSQSILRDRRTVHRAMAVLTAARGLTAADAAATLHRRANDRGMPVRRIADEVIHHDDATPAPSHPGDRTQCRRSPWGTPPRTPGSRPGDRRRRGRRIPMTSIQYDGRDAGGGCRGGVVVGAHRRRSPRNCSGHNDDTITTAFDKRCRTGSTASTSSVAAWPAPTARRHR